uniref:non-specific serine/threonine protein kinase n=1 Tax=Aplanochytrium stocchinoi TaxID=215587 RepID=A0A7S3V3K9_9STRA|mmetsp:Transcript_17045/g.21012  ORF Transcript_17045/g.21012 Transcript_17045/m.21012 type:complete len:333 (-) Transcript_17045:412-1410(-)|eukprot:CAMPEP_0204828732 /NCGR_PEP_ID=MMETSP1346-20131115/6634_1 /ASSEMBLY_ACC=CAM_ASM_000771 /TAXON_ID=215587 /ORGANISM="Aplanochytrium stocchinoi, Strain GSBS06" /LENGTH=332 /DNA_ID=CAMNT_0051958023 /DNA_START=148 /DNA_END=1146 /DNA_ORIENTATION=-
MSFFTTKKASKDSFDMKYDMDTKKDFLGEGQYATVYKAYQKETGKEVAVKVINKKKLSPSDKKALELEIQVLEDIDHPHIVKLIESFDQKKELLLVLELVKGGELFDRIVARSSYSERDAATAISVICRALKYLHSKKIVHRDLKPENLLLVNETDDTNIKIADFGFAAYTEKELDDGCGTLVYVAPEVLRGHGYKTQPDMWSLGIISYILLCGYPPFFDNEQDKLARKIVKGKYKFRHEDWDGISDEAKSFVRGLIKRDPDQRMTADDALEHPWIKNLAAVPDTNLDTTQKAMREFVAKEKMRKALGAVKAINIFKGLDFGEIPDGDELED